MIPVVICPTLNQPDRLRRMIDSIDHEVARIIVIDNGGKVGPDIKGRPLVDVINLPRNAGVSCSWNLGVKMSPTAPWWLFVNDDVEFGRGDLTRLAECVTAEPAIYKMLGLASFAINQAVVETIGWFDENFISGYDEDVDYCRRAELAGIPSIETGFTGTHAGSATIMSDPFYRSQNALTHPANDLYYSVKWHGAKQGGETFTTPFDTGDMNYAPNNYRRLRDLSWKRR